MRHTLHHKLQNWLKQDGIEPFPFQIEAWLQIQLGKSGIIFAPTGMGKTYAAYLSNFIVKQLKHPSPFSFPIYCEVFQKSLSNESVADRIARTETAWSLNPE